MQADALDKQSLALVNAYNPGLSGAWMLQRAMSVRPGEKPDPNFINQARTSCFAHSPPPHSRELICDVLSPRQAVRNIWDQTCMDAPTPCVYYDFDYPDRDHRHM